MDKNEFWLRLLMMKGCRARDLKRLKVKKQLTDYQIEQLLNLVELSYEQKQIFYQIDERTLSTSLDWLKMSGNHLITYHDIDYPNLLKHVKDAPVALFVRGNTNHLNQPQIAMVGSRHFSHYGQQWGRYFASELATQRFVVTSGLALGIDSICHKAVLEQKGITIAVLGSGLADITPRRHCALADDILVNDGVLISEFLPTQPAMPENFPKRNRIISGLAKGVIIVEAALKSGSLITARFALEQGREVFVLPGPLGHKGYEGAHWLIQQGAYLVTKPDDIIEYLNSTLEWLAPECDDFYDGNAIHDLGKNSDEQDLPFNMLLSNVGDNITPIDIIAERMSQSPAEIALQLLELELQGRIISVQGGYIRVRQAIKKSH